jgi:hypothetical protein
MDIGIASDGILAQREPTKVKKTVGRRAFIASERTV